MSKFHWIADDTALTQLGSQQQAGERLFIDTEFMRERTFWPRLALLQVNDGRGCHLIDPTTTSAEPMHDLLALRPLVMHACSEDLEALRIGCNVKPAEVIDTQIGAALCGHDMQTSYQKLVETLLGVSLPKTATRTDWLQRPLSAEQLEYAAHDVEYLPGIYQILYDRLEAQGRLGWWREECDRLVADCQRSTDPDDLWRQVKGAASLDGEGRRRLRQLAIWRDASARQRDIPRSFILKDAEMLMLASRGASHRGQLAETGMHPSALRRFADALLEVLARAEQGEIPEPLPGMPEPHIRERIKRLRAYFNKLAEAHQLAPEVLARRRWVEALARDPECLPEPFGGWRAGLIGSSLGELM
ncbi:MAG: ribonuclease D [Alcanivoracaceae bacterium]|nr:ribonuclease D [Alcanivoracaceae bacterium]